MIIKKYNQLRDYFHCAGKYRGTAHNIFHLIYKPLKEIPILFHNGSTYDYHFVVKKLVKESEKTQKNI